MASKSGKEKSELVRGAGFAAALWIALEAAVREAGGSDEDIHRLGTDEGKDTLCKMAKVAALRGECEVIGADNSASATSQSTAVLSTYPVTVDYSRSMEQMVAAGEYNTKNDNITQEHFPLQGSDQIEVELHLVHLNRDASTDSVLAELDRRGLRPAILAELLAFGAKHPNFQKEFPIIALGSVWQNWGGYRSVACLGSWGGARSRSLGWVAGGWSGCCRFLAVRK